MSGIIRVKKDGGYSVVSNEPFTNQSLSWEARGVMGYLLTKPNGWQCQISDLVNQGPAGKEKIERILDELMEHGYINRRRIRRNDGTFYWETTVFESSLSNPEVNNEELKHRLVQKRNNATQKRKRAYERRLSSGVESPTGQNDDLSTGVLSTPGESPTGQNDLSSGVESPHIVNTESTTTTINKDFAAKKLVNFYLEYIGKKTDSAAATLNKMLEDFPPADIVYAIDQAIEHSTANENKCSLAYIKAVCKRKQSGDKEKTKDDQKTSGNGNAIGSGQASGKGSTLDDVSRRIGEALAAKARRNISTT